MSEFLSPGVFIQEVPSSVNIIQAVSTSTMGMIAGAKKGPTDVATLVSSFEEFTRVFGPLMRDTRGPLAMAAYFANGGRRAYFVRVAPEDAVAASADIETKRYDFQTNRGDGATATVTNLVLTPVALQLPLVPSTVSFSWRATDSAVTGENLVELDGTTALEGDGSKTSFAARIDPASLPAVSAIHFAVTPASITIDAGAASITLTQVGTTAVSTGSGVDGTATMDLRTGIVHMTWTVAPALSTPITIDYTPATATLTISDDGAGVLLAGTVLTGAGSINYTTGAYSFTTTVGNTPHDDAPIVATHRVHAWSMAPISVGDWANNMRVDVTGADDYYTASTDTYTRFNVNVLVINDATGLFEVQEAYEELVFDDTASAQYFPDVINDLSDLISVTEPATLSEAPTQLAGIARTCIIGAGDGDTANRNFVFTLPHVAVQPRSVTVTWTSGAASQTITDDGAGNLIGSIDSTGTNTITYSSGAIDVTVSASLIPDINTFVTVTYTSASEEDTHSERFGDTSKDYTLGAVDHYVSGEDGTFDATNFDRDVFTSPVLAVDYRGLFALNRVDELLQVTIPDHSGDVQITKDLIDYANSREALPSGGDRFVILTTPVGSSAQEAVDFFRFDINQFCKFAALYWPWVRVADPTRDNRLVTFPSVAHVAGIYARTDSTRNVGKAPGGVVDGALRFLDSLETSPSQGERDLVYSNRINSLISGPHTGLAVWGVRTISQTSDWRYINVRRLFMFIEKSIYNSTQWVVFENNGPALWARIRSQLNGFLGGLFNDGLFAGNTPSQAFFVTVNESNNPQASIDQGVVIIDVGIAPNKPAEFVVFRTQQITNQA